MELSCLTQANISASLLGSYQLPIYEPGLDDVVKQCRGKNLFFSTEVEKHLFVNSFGPGIIGGSADLASSEMTLTNSKHNFYSSATKGVSSNHSLQRYIGQDIAQYGKKHSSDQDDNGTLITPASQGGATS